MDKYCSFLIIKRNHKVLVENILNYSDWSASLITDPSGRFRFSEDGLGWSETFRPSGVDSLAAKGGHLGEVLVFQEPEANAYNIVHLIYAVFNVVEGDPTKRYEYPLIPIFREDEELNSKFFKSDYEFSKFVYNEEFPLAIYFASKAWADQSLIYAIHKLAMSFEIESITWWSAYPKHGQIFDKSSESHRSQINTTNAINLAFSAIEELKLQVKSSSEKPRWIDNESGEWNPVVLADIERRLVEVGIDPNQTIEWVVRGDVLEPERKLLPRLGRLTTEADGVVVRDLVLTLPEAIHYCSFLRNFLSAHALSGASRSLGPYDVHNVQCVARTLILSHYNMLGVFTDELMLRIKL